MAIEATKRTNMRRASLRSIVSLLIGSKEPPMGSQAAMGFFTDTSICIGCKACEIACKQWNQLPATEPSWSGSSYDNTRQLGATTWRHVQFIEQIGRGGAQFSAPELPLLEKQLQGNGHTSPSGSALPFFNSERWLMQSDVCKHCANAPCQEACPTTSIVFGEVEQLKKQARERLGILQERGVKEARLYGADDTILQGGLNSFFLLLDEPEVYNLPQNPQRPARNVAPASIWTIIAAGIVGLMGIIFFRE